MLCVFWLAQAELGQLGVRREEGGGEGEKKDEGEGEGGKEREEVDTSVWEEQLQQELQDLDIEVSYLLNQPLSSTLCFSHDHVHT